MLGGGSHWLCGGFALPSANHALLLGQGCLSAPTPQGTQKQREQEGGKCMSSGVDISGKDLGCFCLAGSPLAKSPPPHHVPQFLHWQHEGLLTDNL